MRSAASEHFNNEQMMSRLSATFSALIREEVEIVRRFLASDVPDLEKHEIGPLVELSVRLVERSAQHHVLNGKRGDHGVVRLQHARVDDVGIRIQQARGKAHWLQVQVEIDQRDDLVFGLFVEVQQGDIARRFIGGSRSERPVAVEFWKPVMVSPADDSAMVTGSLYLGCR